MSANFVEIIVEEKITFLRTVDCVSQSFCLELVTKLNLNDIIRLNRFINSDTNNRNVWKRQNRFTTEVNRC